MTNAEPSASTGGPMSASGISFACNGLTYTEEALTIALKAGRPLTFDFSIPSDCFNKCRFCGYKDAQNERDNLKIPEILSVIHQAADIGAKSVRFVGAGEPLTKEEIFLIFAEVRKTGMIPVVFSCGDLLGDDAQCYKIHGFDGREAVARLAEHGVTVMLKYDSKQQDDLTQRPGYSEKRNRALERLMTMGFNLSDPTHLGFGTVVLGWNHKEIPEIVDYAIAHNIYVLNCALMPIGKAEKQHKALGITGEQMITLSSELYKIAWEYGIPFTEPADFPGGLKCFISAAGFFVSPTGRIDPCETHTCDEIGNVREVPLADAWRKINALKDREYTAERRAERKCGPCIAKWDKGIIPDDYHEKVRILVQQYTEANPNKFNSRPRVVTKSMIDAHQRALAR